MRPYGRTEIRFRPKGVTTLEPRLKTETRTLDMRGTTHTQPRLKVSTSSTRSQPPT